MTHGLLITRPLLLLGLPIVCATVLGHIDLALVVHHHRHRSIIINLIIILTRQIKIILHFTPWCIYRNRFFKLVPIKSIGKRITLIIHIFRITYFYSRIRIGKGDEFSTGIQRSTFVQVFAQIGPLVFEVPKILRIKIRRISRHTQRVEGLLFIIIILRCYLRSLERKIRNLI